MQDHGVMMDIYNSLEEILNIEPTVTALGNFDGVHKGHRELIERAVRMSKEMGIKSAVFTFSNHPKNLLTGSLSVKNILYPEDKAKIIERLGIDYLFSIPFNKDMMNMSPEDFTKKLLAEKLNCKAVVAGYNYRFGKAAKGTPLFMKKIGEEKGFGVSIIDPVIVNGQVVSSSLIREFIRDGEMEQCFDFLGRFYSIGGTVVVGNQIGRTIGFPTSNILLDESMVTPAHGVYITYCKYNGTVYPSITNVGLKPTIGDNKKTIETHIFNFNKELYGKKIRVEFVKKTRSEVKFGSVEDLSKQILRDCNTAKEYHMKHPVENRCKRQEDLK